MKDQKVNKNQIDYQREVIKDELIQNETSYMKPSNVRLNTRKAIRFDIKMNSRLLNKR
ncbi:hypothetical protein [Gottfriedia solisilvae]|uniref:Uncharacterized protein n=1 Tax=Gottfriedia solisilvae TaxID=1516104 RepID=A0A8J3F0J1_9BACI|nr:hypothetical protein [Gottfriedia solisilvae]GGI18005.1 hypothetical protein GCM10007380_40770 [Gottfriedia solisilvae]